MLTDRKEEKEEEEGEEEEEEREEGKEEEKEEREATVTAELLQGTYLLPTIMISERSGTFTG